MSCENTESESANDIQKVMRQFNIRILGNGPQTLIFGHGFGCNQDVWQHVAPAFEKNYRVILFDYIGCGQSELKAYSAEKYSSLQAYADDVVMICQTLQLHNSHFVGHSVSGAIAMLASIKAPTLFSQIIAISPSPCYVNDLPDYVGGFNAEDIAQLLDMMDRNYFEWTEYLPPIVVGSAAENDSVDEVTLEQGCNELKAHFIKSDPEICKKFAEVTFLSDIRSKLSFIPVPVVVLYCVEDVVVPVEVIDYLRRHIPQYREQQLSATGHYPQLIYPSAVINVLKEEIANATN